MKLVVGLGNPGRQYERTRHNAGWMVLDRLAQRHAAAERVKSRFHADTLEARLGGERCVLIKPVTWMNRSGQSVAEAVRFYKAEPLGDLLVVTDDLALPVGAIRVRARGGSGGHNGLSDIARVLGGEEWARLRVGIGAKPAFMDQADWVLSRFAEQERAPLEAAIERAADAAELWAAEGAEAAMNRFNEKVNRAEEPPKREDPPPEGVHPGWLGGGQK